MTTTVHPVQPVLQRPSAFEHDVPLVAVERGAHIGSLHRGTVCVADVDGDVVVAVGDPEQEVFLRSAAKPFQVMPAVVSGAIDRFAISERELAILCASHSAEDRHMDTVLGVLQKAGLEEAALRCGVHPPIHETTARRRASLGIEASPVCNNCSGAHAGMLLACRSMGWSIEDYGEPDHPLQVMTREILGAFTAMPADEILFGIDNCAVPTFLVPIRRAAQAFARLATGRGVESELVSAARRVVGAMTTFPEMVAGEGRFDTDLMAAAGGSLVAKGGAEGFQGVGLSGQELGIAVKISDGNARAVPPVTMRVLDGLGAAPDAEILLPYRHPELTNHQGVHVGRLTPLLALESRS